MTITSTLSDDGKQLRLSVTGKFDFHLLREFRQAYSEKDCGDAEIVVDLRDTTFIDSSALGMLLSMKDHLARPDKTIRIVNSRADVRKILDIVKFDNMFLIE